MKSKKARGEYEFCEIEQKVLFASEGALSYVVAQWVNKPRPRERWKKQRVAVSAFSSQTYIDFLKLFIRRWGTQRIKISLLSRKDCKRKLQSSYLHISHFPFSFKFPWKSPSASFPFVHILRTFTYPPACECKTTDENRSDKFYIYHEYW